MTIKTLCEYKDGTQFEYTQELPGYPESQAINYLWEFESFDDKSIFPQPCSNLMSVKIVSVSE